MSWRQLDPVLVVVRAHQHRDCRPILKRAFLTVNALATVNMFSIVKLAILIAKDYLHNLIVVVTRDYDQT